MTKVLITAFEPYDRWKTNASWLALIQLTQDLPREPAVTTRLYPVDFSTVKQRLGEDLDGDYDFALHVGQAPGSGRLQLEAIGLNIGGSSSQSPDEFRPLVADGPVAYRSPLPLARWAAKLRGAGIPAQVSYHAGAYLCNATLYYSCYLTEERGLKTQAAFLHVPLDPSQTIGQFQDYASLSTATTATAIRMLLEELVVRGQ